MAELSAGLATALGGPRPLLVGAIEINLPGYDLLLLDGAGEVMIAGKKFLGRDPTYGVLDSIKGLSDAVGDQAPVVTITLLVPTTTALAALLDPTLQGSPTTISINALNMQTGLPLGDPYIPFIGELDVPTAKWGKNTRSVEFRVTSVAERLFQVEEGHRLSDSFHRSIWPGETGFEFATGVEDYVPWGQKLDLTAVTTRTNNASIGVITTKRT